MLTEADSCSEFRSLESDLDEFHHKATRTLFIGNLDKAVTKDMLRDTFTKFGHIVVCIGVTSYLLYLLTADSELLFLWIFLAYVLFCFFSVMSFIAEHTGC